MPRIQNKDVKLEAKRVLKPQLPISPASSQIQYQQRSLRQDAEALEVLLYYSH